MGGFFLQRPSGSALQKQKGHF